MVELELATFEQIAAELEARQLDFVLLHRVGEGYVIHNSPTKSPIDMVRDLLSVTWQFINWVEYNQLDK